MDIDVSAESQSVTQAEGNEQSIQISAITSITGNKKELSEEDDQIDDYGEEELKEGAEHAFADQVHSDWAQMGSVLQQIRKNPPHNEAGWEQVE